MRILILGGTGFIGSHVLHALRGLEVTVFHRGQNCERAVGVRHIHGDLSNLHCFRGEFLNMRLDVVLDMVSQNDSDAQRVVDCMTGIANRIALVSSISVYRSFGVMVGTENARIDNQLATEDAPVRTKMFPYRGLKRTIAQASIDHLANYDKIAAERAYMSQSGVHYSIIRLPMVYGPSDPDLRLTPYLERMLDGHDTIYIKKTVASWCNSRAFVANVARAISCVVLLGEVGKVYNYAEPENFTEATWIHRIGSAVNWNGTIELIDDGKNFGYPSIGELPQETNFAQHLIMDSTRIRRELGYVELVSSDQALRLTVDGLINSLPIMKPTAPLTEPTTK